MVPEGGTSEHCFTPETTDAENRQPSKVGVEPLVSANKWVIATNEKDGAYDLCGDDACRCQSVPLAFQSVQ
jgi:hypothetical protein